jgi:hypothetical protein
MQQALPATQAVQKDQEERTRSEVHPSLGALGSSASVLAVSRQNTTVAMHAGLTDRKYESHSRTHMHGQDFDSTLPEKETEDTCAAMEAMPLLLLSLL